MGLLVYLAVLMTVTTTFLAWVQASCVTPLGGPPCQIRPYLQDNLQRMCALLRLEPGPRDPYWKCKLPLFRLLTHGGSEGGARPGKNTWELSYCFEVTFFVI